MSERAQVVVVGAGPVGLATAALLGRAGWEVTVLEARSEATPLDESRAITWMPEGLLLADELGITERLAKVASVRTRHEFRREPDGDAFLTMRFDRLDHRHPYTLNLPQRVTEDLLQDAALATGRVVLRRGVRIDRFDRTDGGVAAVGEDELHGAVRVEARLGIAADGAGSTRRGAARALGIPGRFWDYGAHSVVADVELEKDPAPGDVSWIALDARRPMGLFRFGDRRWRLVYRVNPGERASAASPETVAERAAAIVPHARVNRILWASTFRLGQGQAASYSSGAWVLVGDAAHAMGPSAGAGMMVGLLGAWRLAIELGRHPEPTQAAVCYEATQRAVSRRVQRSNGMIFRNIALRSPALAGLRTRALSLIGRIPAVAAKLTAREALVGLAPVRPA